MNRTLSGGLVLLACCVIAACKPSSAPHDESSAPSPGDVFTPAAEAAAATITADVLRSHVAQLSSDAFEGRGPATRGDELTRAYLVEQLTALGFQPGAADSGWQQPVELVGIKAEAPQRWRFEHEGRRLDLKWWDDFVAASGVQSETAAIDAAEVVFVGYGIQAPEYQWDDFKGQDLKGKVLVMLNNDPDWDPALFQGKTRLYYGRWVYKYESAARQGAAGAIIIHTTPSAGYPFQVVQSSNTGEQFDLPATGEPRVQVQAWATEQAVQSLLALAGFDLAKLAEAARSRDFRPVPLGITTSLKLRNTVSRKASANVLGLLPGSDPALRQQVVVYSAHHDHFGIGEPDAEGDRIYNGARDNGTGMAQILAIARAFSALPQRPRRSVLMAFVAAEEQGLLGSLYYANHPSIPAGRIAANINYDSGNIWGRTRDVTLVGLGKSTLDAVAQRVVERQGRMLKPDQFPDRGYYYRSDQFNFAKIGVPALYFKAGTDFVDRPAGWGEQQMVDHETHRYHQPSDELGPEWNFDGMIEDAQLGFWSGLIVANDDDMPAWVPGDEFEAARQRALAAVQD